MNDANLQQTCNQLATDCISRQAAIEALRAEVVEDLQFGDELTAGYNDGLNMAITIMSKLPSAEPEITHCAECIHWKHSSVRKNYCDVFDWVNKAEDFCSFAERKTNEE